MRTWEQSYCDLLPAGYFDADHSRMRREMWTRMLNDPGSEWTVRVAEVDGRMVGFARSGPSSGPETTAGPAAASDGTPPRERQLYNIYVLDDAHGTGIGQALLDAVIGDEPALLWVAAQNPRAITFYRRNGFEFDGTEQVDPGAPLITDARMVR